MNKNRRYTLSLFSLVFFCSLNTQASTLLLDGGGRNFGPGDALNLSVGIQHNEALMTVDAYLALVMPDSNILFFSLGAQGGLNSHPGDASPANWTPLLSNLQLFTGMNTGLVPIFNYVVSGTEQLGDYQWLLGTTPSGNREILDIAAYSFRVVKRNISSLLGTWSGSWTNTTFLSSGGASLSVENHHIPGTLKLTIDLDGFVGGLLDPEPETLIATINPNGNISYTGQIEKLGPLTFTLTPGGQLTINANDIDVSGFESFTATGSLVGNQLNLNYSVNFSFGDPASGTVTGQK